jgi:hypothetical protein
MSTDRNELHELVDQLADDQVAPAADELRNRLARAGRIRSTKPLAWVGAGVTMDGSTDVSTNVDDYLVGFGHDSL